jgi:NAD(P)H-nitrite reductase large subunit
VREGGQLVGAMLVGNTDAASTLVQLFDRGDPLPRDPLEVLCQLRGGGGGSLERLICNCHKVTVGVLKEAIGNGADSIAAIGALTKAGTGCGSCKTELGQLITSLKKSPPLLTAAS